jgi:hypothetical protein
MQNVLIRTGHGYEQSDRGRCEAFDGFETIAAPLHQEGEGWQAAFGNEARASRIYNKSGVPGRGVTYGSHAIKLAKMPHDSALYILMHHGGGREVWRVPEFYDGGDLAAHIIGLPERLQYALLYTLYSLASDARRQGQTETRAEWSKAIADKRIRRRKGRVEIIPQWEIDLKAEAKRRAA